MKEIVATITSKGQVTIPAAVRRHLHVRTKDKITFVMGQEGRVELKVPQYRNVASLRGAAGSLSRPLSWAQMRDTAREDRWAGSDSTEP